MNSPLNAPLNVTVNSQSAIDSLRQLSGEMERFSARGRSVRNANDNTAGSLDRLGQQARGAAQEGGALNSVLGDLRSRAAGANPAVSGLVGNLTSMGRAGAVAAGAVTLTAAAMVKATGEANKYADVMAKISTNVDTSKFRMGELSEGILKQSAAFGSMPVAQAEAAYDIISAGAETASKALELLTAANGLAVGGITNVGVAADGLTSIVNSYAGMNLKAADASDAMFISARDGKTTIEQLSSEVGKVTPLAATMGVTFDEVAGSLAVLTKGGISTSESVTGVRAILSSIAKPSEEAKKAAKGIGLEWSVAALQANGLRGVLQDMADKTGNSTTKMAVLLGGVEALVPALALTANGGREFASTMDNMATKAGATAEAVKKIMDGSPTAQWNRVTASANAELVKLGNTASQFAVPAMRFLADNMSTIVTVAETALIPLSIRLIGLWGTAMVQSIVTLAATATMRFASMAAAQGALAASTATLSAGMNGLLGILGGPLGIAIGAVAVGLYTLHTNSSAANSTISQLAASSEKSASEAAQTAAQSLLAARGTTTFGGAAGKAAEQLWQMARAAKAAAIESARLQLVKSVGQFRQTQELTDRGFANAQARDNDIVTGADASIGDRARALGRSVQRGWNKTWAPDQKKVTSARDAAFAQAQRDGDALRKLLNQKEETFLPPTASRDKGGFAEKKDGAGKKSDAQKMAERAADWMKKVEADGKDAQATYEAMARAAAEGRNLAVASNDTAKALEYQRLVSRDLTDAERGRIETALQQGRIAKLLGDELVAAESRKATISTNQAALDLRRNGMGEAQIGIEKAVLEWRQRQRDLGATEADLRGAALTAAEARVRLDALTTSNIERQNKALDEQVAKLNELARAGADYANTALRDNGSIPQRRAAAKKEYDDRIVGMLRAFNDPDASKRISAEAFMAGTKQAGVELQARFREIGTEFQNRMNNVADLFDRIGGLIGGKLGRFFDRGRDLADGIGNFENTKSDIAKQIGEVFGKNGKAVEGIGKAVGGAVGGLQIGESIGGLTKALGIKTSGTGAKLGGAIGGAVAGPVGSIVGSLIGGIGGGLFKKTKSGAATVSGGDAAGISLSGRGASYKKEAGTLAGQLQSGLQDIAQRLGGTVGSFGALTIGKRGDDYRINTTGAATLKNKKKGVQDFGDDAAAALGAAMKIAIQRGAVQGLSDLAQKALGALEPEAAITLVGQWNDAMRDLSSMTDPVTAAVQNVTDGLKGLREGMVSVGASTTDLTRLDEYRSKKLDEVLKEQTSGLRDIMDRLKGDAGGVSDYRQLQNKLVEFEKFKADAAAGKSVDQAAYANVVDAILSKKDSVFAPQSKEALALVDMVRGTTESLIGNATTQFNSAAGISVQPVVAALDVQTQAYLAAQNTSNDLLAENNQYQARIVTALEKLAGGGGYQVEATGSRVALVLA